MGRPPSLVCEEIHKLGAVKRIAESTVRRLSLYLRYLEDFEESGLATISSDELAKCGGTTSAQVRKDLSFFGSFGKRGLGYSVPELSRELKEILGLDREWKVIIVGAGKIGTALAQYRGFRQRGFKVIAVYDHSPEKIGRDLADCCEVRDIASLEKDASREHPEVAVLAVPGNAAQAVAERVVAAGIKGILNFAPVQLQVPDDVTVRAVNMAMELEALSFSLASAER